MPGYYTAWVWHIDTVSWVPACLPALPAGFPFCWLLIWNMPCCRHLLLAVFCRFCRSARFHLDSAVLEPLPAAPGSLPHHTACLPAVRLRFCSPFLPFLPACADFYTVTCRLPALPFTVSACRSAPAGTCAWFSPAACLCTAVSLGFCLHMPAWSAWIACRCRLPGGWLATCRSPGYLRNHCLHPFCRYRDSAAFVWNTVYRLRRRFLQVRRCLPPPATANHLCRNLRRAHACRSAPAAVGCTLPFLPAAVCDGCVSACLPATSLPAVFAPGCRQVIGCLPACHLNTAGACCRLGLLPAVLPAAHHCLPACCRRSAFVSDSPGCCCLPQIRSAPDTAALEPPGCRLRTSPAVTCLPAIPAWVVLPGTISPALCLPACLDAFTCRYLPPPAL